MVSVKLPKMTKPEIDQLLSEQFLCRIAFNGEPAPYIAPFQYAFLKGALYFHFTGYGKKLGLLKEDSRVCVEVEQYTLDLAQYSFVTLVGNLQVVVDLEEKTAAVKRMVQVAKEKGLSPNFLAAHGLPAGSAWPSLNSVPSQIIVKLVDVADVVGLKSP
ncbi:MAG: pyridoxamine 5'-phosphate oxidase family protein [Candidatus Bathyarchaeota archaeon]|nr:pyridoxamine 5'-phosphate oxidase family protein [Candidatus Bathyarchaeota archaeon]